MSDPTPNPSTPEGGNPPSGTTPTAGDEFKPITSQGDLDRIIGERVGRERAKYADYADVKAKAATVDQVTAAAEQKTKEVEAALAGVPAKVTETLRSHLVTVHKIDAADAELFLTATEPETLLKQVERLTARGASPNLRVPREGTPTGDPKADEERAAARKLFGSGAA
jgi:hypothetical protein